MPKNIYIAAPYRRPWWPTTRFTLYFLELVITKINIYLPTIYIYSFKEIKNCGKIPTIRRILHNLYYDTLMHFKVKFVQNVFSKRKINDAILFTFKIICLNSLFCRNLNCLWNNEGHFISRIMFYFQYQNFVF